MTTLTTVAPPYGELWLVARLDVGPDSPITTEQRSELFAWLESLSLPYRECLPTLVVTSNAEDKRLLLHLSRFSFAADGTKYIDFAANALASTPLVVEISDYPAWLVQASTTQDQLKET
jgi:hypothetical protein